MSALAAHGNDAYEPALHEEQGVSHVTPLLEYLLPEQVVAQVAEAPEPDIKWPAVAQLHGLVAEDTPTHEKPETVSVQEVCPV